MPKNKKRADGRIQAKVFIGSYNGRKNYKYVYGKTQKEVDEKVLELKLSLKKGIDVTAERDTFKDWAEHWLEIKKLEVSYNWFLALCSRVNNFEPLFNIPITKIRTSDIQKIFIKCATEPNKKNNKPYARKTLRDMKIVVTSVFQLAIENRVLDFNPANAVKIPNAAETVKKRALTEEEQQWIINTPHRAQRSAMIMMFAGLRRGELIPLTWNDIDLVNGTISINKSVEFINGMPVVKNTAKTKSSLRTVYIPKILIEFLKNEKRDSFIVCPNTKGKIMAEFSWRELWESYLVDLNLKYGDFSNNINTKGKTPKSKYSPKKSDFVIPRFTAHWLRHTFITMMYFAGIDILTAKEQAGHADIKTTMEIYTHLDGDYKKKSMLKLNEFLSKSDENIKCLSKE